MAKILVAGLINIETTVQIEQFPLEYSPVRYPFFGVNSTVSGVGYNVAKALRILGNDVNFLSLLGQDFAGDTVIKTCQANAIATDYLVQKLKATPQSAILYDKTGRRQINVDLKDIQEQMYPPQSFNTALQGCDLAVLCNINFTRAHLHKVRTAGIPLATDVHTIAQLDSNYDSDYMRAADILFMSNENLPCAPEDWVRQLWEHYNPAIIVVGLGAEGALLATRNPQIIQRLPAVPTRPIVNTIGAGDALFSAFLHFYAQKDAPYLALQKAQLFASWKIGVSGAADGFITAPELEKLFSQFL